MFHQKFGLSKGQVAQIALPNTTEYHAPVFGVWMCSATSSVVDPRLELEVLVATMQDSDPKLIICTDDNLNMMQQGRIRTNKPDIPIIVLGETEADVSKRIYNFYEIIEQGQSLEDENGPDPDQGFNIKDRCNIIWSSGTTGRPKGIQVSYETIRNIISKDNDGLRGAWLATTNFYHGNGYMAQVSRVFNGQSMHFFSAKALEGNIEVLLKAVDKFKPTAIMAGSHHIMQLANSGQARLDMTKALDLSSLMLIIPLGSNVYGDVSPILKSIFPKLTAVANPYSMTAHDLDQPGGQSQERRNGGSGCRGQDR